MPFNLPKYDRTRFSIGPCVMYMGPPRTSGGAPTRDVGAIRSGATLDTSRTKTEVYLGNPKTLVDQFATQDSATLKVTSIEWNVANLAAALAVSEYTQGQDAIGGAITDDSPTVNGDDVSGSFTLTSGMAVVPGTFQLLDGGTPVATDDGTGNITGTNVSSGTIDYAAGTYSITFNAGTAPSSPTASASEGELLCSDASADLNYLFLKWPYVSPGSVTITAQSASAALTVTDDSNGNLTGDVTTPETGDPADTNTIEYESGKVVVKWSSAPSGVIVASYNGTKEETLDFGGATDFTDVAIRLMHDTPKGFQITWDIWKAQGDGSVSISFSDDPHEFPTTYNAIIPFDPCTKRVLDWEGNELPSGKQLFRITIKRAAAACTSTC